MFDDNSAVQPLSGAVPFLLNFQNGDCKSEKGK